jgi:hypothetical protein
MTEEKVIDPNITSDDKLWALLSYLLSPIVPIIVLVMEDKKNRPWLKLHAVQSLIWSIIYGLIASILTATLIGALLGIPVLIAGFVFSIIWAIKAYNGEEVKIPVITDFVKKQGWA